MRKLIAALNMTLDGFCDHTAVNADDELHRHFSDLLRDADTILYGRKTFELMEYWRPIVAEPTGNAANDEFAKRMDSIWKIVYSRTLDSVDWKTAELKREIDKDDILELKRRPGKNILAGSPSLIVAMANMGLIDEFQPVIHPVVLGGGLPLFKNITERIDLKLLKTKTFASGAVAHHYQPANGQINSP